MFREISIATAIVCFAPTASAGDDDFATLHDGRLLTLEDTVEFFNLVLELKLKVTEKKDLVGFLGAL